MIPFAPWEPDRSKFNPNVSDVLKNVVVHEDHLAPFPALVTFSSALAAAPKGAFIAWDDNSDPHIFAGTATKLYKLNTSTLAWDDVSKPATTYALGSSDNWAFTQFGDWVIATNRADNAQYFDLSGGATFVDLNGSPGAHRLAFTTGDFLVFGDDRQITWSGLNAPEFWTPRKRSSDFQIFPDGGQLLAGVGFERGALIFQDNAIREMLPAFNSPMVFTFQKSNEQRGAISPRAVASTGDQVFYLSQDGVFEYGRPSKPIGFEKVDNFMLDTLDTTRLWMTEAAVDPVNQVVYWRYKTSASVGDNTTDRVLAYHYRLGQFVDLEIELSGLLAVTTPGYTLEGLDALGNLDALPYSLDSRAYAAGAPVLGAFDASYKLGIFQGDPLEATARTGAVRLNDANRTYVRGFRPITDAGGVTGRVGCKSVHSSSTSWKTSAGLIDSTGIIPTRADARLHEFEVTIPASEAWTALHGVEPDGKVSGAR